MTVEDRTSTASGPRGADQAAARHAAPLHVTNGVVGDDARWRWDEGTESVAGR